MPLFSQSIGRKIVGIALGLIILMVITSILSMAMSSQVGVLLGELTNRYIPAYGHLAQANIQSVERALALRRMVIAKMQTPPDEEGYAALLDGAGLTVQARAPMTPCVKLVFGVEYDKTRITEFAAVLTHAQRRQVPQGGLDAFLEVAEGGIKGVVAAERALKRPAPRPDIFARAAEELRNRPVLAHVEIAAGDGEFVVLLARASGNGLDVVARVDGDAALTERAVRKAAA